MYMSWTEGFASSVQKFWSLYLSSFLDSSVKAEANTWSRSLQEQKDGMYAFQDASSRLGRTL